MCLDLAENLVENWEKNNNVSKKNVVCVCVCVFICGGGWSVCVCECACACA